MKHDVIIVGGGPAALSAAIYTSRENIDTVIIEKALVGGQASNTDWIDNYPGFPKGLSGLELAEKFNKQAERFGAQIEFGDVTKISKTKDCFELDTSDEKYFSKALLLASGTGYRKLEIPGEKKYTARGVHYCATCDGAFYRDKSIVVIGGGNSAAQESLFLTRFASHVDLLVRSELRASDVLKKQLQDNKKITVHLGVKPYEIVGDADKATKVLAKDASDKNIEFATDGIFVFIGLVPHTDYLKGSGVLLDEAGFVKTNHQMQTNIKGIFAAGDVRSGSTKQIACAVGEGATAALRIREYLETLK